MYIPKNKITTNLFTNTGEFITKQTQEIYIGFYWKTYEGRFFTGKTPNDLPTYELEKIKKVEEGFNVLNNQSEIALMDTPFPFGDNLGLPYNESLVIGYSKLKKINLNKSSRKNLPNSFYPKPTPEDYELGVFTRYFVVKSNENLYWEVDKDTYSNILSKNEEWLWELYIPFKLQWTLKGDKKEVYETNKKETQTQEKNLKKTGLSKFLRDDYLKFYKD